MLTLDTLRQFGADVDSGLSRCMNKEDFYFMLIKKSVKEPGFGKLKDALEQRDLDAAFEFAHSLKGVAGNLSLTPIFEPVSEMTELLRSRTDTDYSELMEKVLTARDELEKLCES